MSLFGGISHAGSTCKCCRSLSRLVTDLINCIIYPLYILLISSLLVTPGPISSILVNKFGSRPIILVGGCLAGTGLVCASFCNTVEQLYFCIGVVGGQ